MALKVSNETKIGALTAITITLFILGFNFLKGKSPLKKAEYLYARFTNIDGLTASNAVMMNGLAIGSVYETVPGDAELTYVLVKIRLTEDVKIPENSVARIKSNPLGSTSVGIVKGTSNTFLEPGDTIRTEEAAGMLGGLVDRLEPTQKALNAVLYKFDSVTGKVNTTLTPEVQRDLQFVVSNLRAATGQLTITLGQVNRMFADQNSALQRSLNNMSEVSGTLAQNKDKFTAIASNLETTTAKLAQADIDATLKKVDDAVASLKATMEKLKDPNGSLGAVLNDRRLYNNATSAINSMNLLMQDIRLHPKRYVNISVFGGKSKPDPLMRPLTEDSLTQEQYVPDNRP